MDINRKIFMGIVEDNKDPNKKGRIKVRVQTLFHCLAIEDIPYASPFAGLAGKRFEVPAIGKIVNVVFFNDNLYDPYYIYSENYNINLQNKLNSLSDEQYVDFIALLFDQKTQIYVKDDELTIDQLLNKITITNDNKNSINIELKDNRQILNLGTRNSEQDAVLGTNFFRWMDKFIDELSNPSSLIGNMGAPVLKPILNQLCQEYKLKRPTFVSEHVKIVDNGKVNILKRTPDTDNRKNDVNLIIPPDQCSEYEQQQGGKDINTELKDIIQYQNDKSCNELKEAAATKDVPYVEHPSANSNLELTSKEVLKVWDKKSQEEIDKLHPEMQPVVIKFFNLCEANGYQLKITSGLRDAEKQKDIKKEMGDWSASPGNSPHEYGLAIDVECKKAGNVSAKLSQQGKSACSDRNNCNQHWTTIGQIAESVGLRWGLDFSTKKEAWHFDMFNKMSKEMQALWQTKWKWPKDSNGWVILNGTPNYDTDQYKQQNYASTQKSKKCKGKDNFNQKDPYSKLPAETTADDKIPSTGDCKNDATKILLDQIANGEGTTDEKARKFGYNSAYDVPIGYGKWSSQSEKPISQMTVGEIKEYQKQLIKNGAPSSAVGKYQIIGKTFNGLQKRMNLSDDMVFSPELQDRMGEELLKIRGYDKWLDGKLSDDKFQTNLAHEWASIAKPGTNQSAYNQHVGTTDSQIKNTMYQVKTEISNCA